MHTGKQAITILLLTMSMTGCGLVATNKTFIPPPGTGTSNWGVDSKICKNFAGGNYVVIGGVIGQALDEDAYLGCMELKGYVHDGWGWNWHKFKPEKRDGQGQRQARG